MPSKITPPQSSLANHQMDLFVQINGLSLRIPHHYLEERLKCLGPLYFNCPNSASCKLSFIDSKQSRRNKKDGNSPARKIISENPSTSVTTNSASSRKRSYSSLSTDSLDACEYWGHELFLSVRSQWFRDFFANHYDENGVNDPRADYASDENGQWLRIIVDVREPSKSRIDELLYWIYTGNDDRWLRNAFTPKNYVLIAENVRILGLDAEAMAVCTRYKASLVCPRCLIIRTGNEIKTDGGECESGKVSKGYNKCIKPGCIIQRVCENISEGSGEHISNIGINEIDIQEDVEDEE